LAAADTELTDSGASRGAVISVVGIAGLVSPPDSEAKSVSDMGVLS
jgi:hypothetical protein